MTRSARWRIPRRPDDAPPALSFGQERLWLLSRLAPESAAYHNPAVVRLTGPLDVAALERSIQAIVARHAVFRMRFSAEGGRPVVALAPSRPLAVERLDLGALPEALRKDRLRDALDAAIRRPFDLAEGPLVRAALIRLGPEEHVLAIVSHLLVSDGWSLRIWQRELIAHHGAFSTGGRTHLPPLPIDYLDFAAWQRGQGAAPAEALDVWERRLRGAPALLDLPADRPRPRRRSLRGGNVRLRIPGGVLEALEALGRSEGATLFMTALAALMALLHRLTGHTDLCVGSPVSGRLAVETEPLIGFFLNTVVLRSDLGGDPSFREVVRRVSAVVVEALAHQDVPFEQVVQRTRPERSAGRSPLFQVMLAINNAPMTGASIGPLRVEPVEVDPGTAQHDLTLSLSRGPDGLVGNLNFCADLFEKATIERMAGHLAALIEAAVIDPDREIAALPLLGPAERRRVLSWSARVPDAPPAPTCLHRLFEERAAAAPDHIAAIFEGRALSCAELDRRANRLAHLLASLGAGPETRVGLSVDRSLEMLVGLLGILKAGGAFVPLDPRSPAERLARIGEDAGFDIVVTEAGHRPRLPARVRRVVELDGDAAEIARQPDEPPGGRVDPRSLAYVIYTSGSTGTPNGVMIEHGSLANLATAEAATLGVGPASRILQFASLGFDASLWEIAAALASGATLCLARREVVQSPRDLVDLMRRERITHAKMPPSVIAALPDAELPDLEVLISAGEPCTAALVERFASRLRFFNAYGPTEATVWATLGACAEGEAPPLGRPIRGARVYVLDDRRAPVPFGVAGEIYVGGLGVARGYWKRPALDAQRFFFDPFSPEPAARMFRTGDRARLRADGRLEFLGRADRQVKVRGFRIELGEVEAALRRHPAVRDAAVEVEQDAHGVARLLAFIAADPPPPLGALRASLAETLPDYMIPSRFVPLARFPMTAHGKLDRAALARLGAAPACAAPRATAQPIDGWFHEPVWTPAPLGGAARRAGGPRVWLVLSDGGPLAVELARCLEQRGDAVVVAHRAGEAPGAFRDARRVDPARPGAFEGLLRELAREGRAPTDLLHLWSAEGAPAPVEASLEAALAEAERQLADGFFSLRALGRALADRPSGRALPRLWVVSTGAQRVLGGEVLAPARAAALGLCRALPREIEGLRCRSIDLEPTELGREAAARLLDELDAEVSDPVVAHRSGRRWIQGFSRVRLDAGAALRAPLRPRGVYLITGGLGGVGLALAERLAAVAGARLALVTRSGRPPGAAEDAARRLRAIETAGGAVLALSADVADPSQLRAALDAVVERFGRVDGVVHAAGVSRPGMLVRAGPESAAEVLRPKVQGTLILDHLLRDHRPDFIALCSSVASILGGLGGADYASANAFLDAFAESRRERGVLSLGWGTFREVGMAARAEVPVDLEAIREAQMQRGMLPEQGADAFLRALSRRGGWVLIAPGDVAGQAAEPAIFPGVPSMAALVDRAPAALAPRPELSGPFVAPEGGVERRIAAILRDVLRVDPVGATDDFFELGGHSLTASMAAARVSDDFGVELPLSSLFERPTVRGLSAAIAELRGGRASGAQPAIPRRSAGGPAPLSLAQSRLWFLEQLEATGAAYNIAFAVRLRGPLDRAALAFGIDEIARRHEVLRAVFPLGPDGPEQRVTDARIPLADVDLRGVPGALRDGEALRRIAEEASARVDLSRGPLTRGMLVRLDEREHVLALLTHHIAWDAWSTRVFVRELSALYDAARAGRASPLPPLPLQYSDHAAWERAQLDRGSFADSLRYFEEHLAGAPASIDLPADRPRPAVQSFEGAREPVHVPLELARELRAICRRERATLFAGLLAAYAALLARHGDTADIVIGSPVHLRPHPDLERLVGLFINTRVLRLDLTDDPSFIELLARARRVITEAARHQELPYELLVEKLGRPRTLGAEPLFQALLSLDNVEAPPLSLSGLHIEPFDVPARTAKFDLGMSLVERDDLRGFLEYRTDLFDGATIRRLAERFVALLRAAVVDPGRPIGALPIASDADRRAMEAWSCGPRLASTPCPVHRAFSARARAIPDATALRFRDGAMCYEELDRRSSRLARRLRDLGVGPEVPVAVSVGCSPASVVALLGVWKASGVFVPLDEGAPPARAAQILAAAAPKVILSRACPASTLPPTPTPRITLGLRGEIDGGDGDAPPPDLASDRSLAYVLFTSGSTGRPKGVMVEHGSLAHTLGASLETFGFRADDVACCLAPTIFDIHLFELLNPLLVGATVRLLERDEVLDLPRLVEAVRDATVLHAVPSLMRPIVQHLEERASGSGRLRLVFVGGERVPPGLLADMGRAMRGAAVHVLYGPTEAAIICASHAVSEGEPPARPVLGRPLPGVTLRLLDRRGVPALPGVAGEIHIGGPGVARGYLGDPEATEARFVMVSGERCFRSGDVGRHLPDGTIAFLGRSDHQEKIRGVRVEPGEIEAALRRHVAVRDALVVGREDDAGGRRIEAYVVPREGERPSPDELTRFLRGELPEPMVPEAYALLDAFPLTATGKIDRDALPPAARVAAPRPTARALDPLERLIAGVWAELLRVDEVGATDDFFALGGHSLLTVQVLARLRRTLGVDVPLEAFFRDPTPAGVARASAELLRGTAAPPRRPIPRAPGPPFPLSFAQATLWGIDRVLPGVPLFGVSAAFELAGPLDRAVLAQAFQALLQRHDVLTARFIEGEGGPAQIPGDAAEVALTWLDVGDAAALQRAQVLEALVERERGRRFDLAAGPPLHAAVIRIEERRHVLLLTVHHIACDGWSIALLGRELGELYAALSTGRRPRLRDLPLRYGDFATWQRGWQEDQALSAQLARLRTELGAAPPLELPGQRTVEGTTLLISSRSVGIGHAQRDALRRLCAASTTTLFMVLLAGFCAALHRLTGAEDLRIATPVANRAWPGTEDLVGLLANMVILRCEARAGMTGVELLESIRAAVLRAYLGQEIPFEELARLVTEEQGIPADALCRVLFVAQSFDAETVRVGDLVISSLPTPEPPDTDGEIALTTFDLLCSVTEREEGLLVRLRYKTKLFELEAMERLLAVYVACLERIAADPTGPFGSAAVHGERELVVRG
ncbi:amino acid adenylation domain-containing protein [Sorangium sp. So ce1097]|uniref:amino acid adenylation domain-containing protein n=1 Tax=Sorangium sp. So ce1097 TaxID=3133330 RepID=UPI003F5DF5E3